MSSHAPRIAYFGLPLGALALMRHGFVPHAVVLEHTDAPGARRLGRALPQSCLQLHRPKLDQPRTIAALAAVQPDVILSWFYPKRIPSAVLALAARGAFGVHPSLLPRWRGPDPYYWALYAGDAITGVTLHRLAEDYDTGASIDQIELPIAPEDNAWRLAKRLDTPGLRLLVRCAERLAAGEALRGVPQDEARASAAPAPDEPLLRVDWRRPAHELVRLVRAAAPEPGASALLGDQFVEVLEASVYPHPLPRALAPAEAVRTPSGIAVCTGAGGVLLARVRDEEGRILRGPALAGLFPGGLSAVDHGSTQHTP